MGNWLILVGMLLLPLLGMAENRIVVSKQRMELYVVSQQSDTLFRAEIGCGKNYGDKRRKGDLRTPEGKFRIVSIEQSSAWKHDFNDGYGMRKGAYGPYFIRLKTPGFTGIGIHGTCFPESIGTRSSEGCIRLKNEDLLKLVGYVSRGMICEIESD